MYVVICQELKHETLGPLWLPHAAVSCASSPLARNWLTIIAPGKADLGCQRPFTCLQYISALHVSRVVYSAKMKRLQIQMIAAETIFSEPCVDQRILQQMLLFRSLVQRTCHYIALSKVPYTDHTTPFMLDSCRIPTWQTHNHFRPPSIPIHTHSYPPSRNLTGIENIRPPNYQTIG